MADDLQFKLIVLVMEADGIKSVPANHKVYCTIDVRKEGKLQTELAEAGKPSWNTEGDYDLTYPLPVVKLKLYAENASLLAFDDKALGKLVLKPMPHASQQVAEWQSMIVPKNTLDRGLRLKVMCRMENPPNMKHCGFLYAVGKVAWKKWKRRYFVLYESDGKYVLRSFKEKRSENTEIIVLDSTTLVDYIEPEKAKLMVGVELKGGRFFFTVVLEGEGILFATEDEKECKGWVTAIYKATGQDNKPVYPTSSAAKSLATNAAPSF